MALYVPPPSVPSLTVAGRTFTDLKNLIVTSGGFAGAANGQCTPRRGSGSSGYLPSGSKAFRVLAIQFYAVSVAPGSFVGYFYCDNDLGIATATAATNGVYPGNDARCSYISSATSLATTDKSVEFVVDFLVPNGKYFSVTSNGSALNCSFRVYGYEE